MLVPILKATIGTYHYTQKRNLVNIEFEPPVKPEPTPLSTVEMA